MIRKTQVEIGQTEFAGGNISCRFRGRSVVGRLLWPCQQTRWDLTHRGDDAGGIR